jgi:Skp family chaperone for outer membrane proteins
MKKLLLLSCLFITPVVAAEVTPTPDSLAWLDERGVVSTDEITKVLGGKFSPAEREKLDNALAKRNIELQKANVELAATLRELLSADDKQIAKRVEQKANADKEAEKLALMKRTQPARYQAYMRNKAKNERKEKEQ